MEIAEYLDRLLHAPPSQGGVARNRRGWVRIGDVLEAMAHSGRALDHRTLRRVVHDQQHRFALSRDGASIRSVGRGTAPAQDPPASVAEPPALLYHAAPRRLQSEVAQAGLQSRGSSSVRLYESPRAAMEMGVAYGDASLLTVRVPPMRARGFIFRKAESGLWLVVSVPADCLLRW